MTDVQTEHLAFIITLIMQLCIGEYYSLLYALIPNINKWVSLNRMIFLYLKSIIFLTRFLHA
jgi:hypothetical protein